MRMDQRMRCVGSRNDNDERQWPNLWSNPLISRDSLICHYVMSWPRTKSCQNHPKASGTAAGLQQPWCWAATPIPALCSTQDSRAGSKNPNPVLFLNARVNQQGGEGRSYLWTLKEKASRHVCWRASIWKGACGAGMGLGGSRHLRAPGAGTGAAPESASCATDS